jgi:hypothetical protein
MNKIFPIVFISTLDFTSVGLNPIYNVKPISIYDVRIANDYYGMGYAFLSDFIMLRERPSNFYDKNVQWSEYESPF